MYRVDDFGLGGKIQGVLPSYRQSLPTDIRNSRPFMTMGSNLPKFYYDIQAQKQFHSLRRLRTRIENQ